MKHSNYSGRAPRSLHQAFGPYTSRQFSEQRRRSAADVIAEVIYWLSALAMLAAAFTAPQWWPQ